MRAPRTERTPLVSERRTNASLAEIDRQSSLHPFTSIADHLEHGPHIVVEGKGIRVKDTEGREYLDAMAGLWCVNVGYGRREIVDAARAQLERLSFYHSFASMANEPAIRLAERLLEIAPGRMSRVFFGNSGSDANDTQVKLVWYYNNLRGKPEKKKIIARRRSYHGVTLGAASMTGLGMVHASFDLPLPGFLHVTAPHAYREAPAGMSERAFTDLLVRELDERIEAEGPETVGAFIAEPVMGAGGVLVPPTGYFEGVQEVLRKHDVLMIADEVICGFGRLGAMFGCEVYGIEPDLVTLAKGLTSGYVPMSACLISDSIWEVLSSESTAAGAFTHGYTYSGHPVAAAAALANLRLIERDDLVANARSAGAYLQMSLRESFGNHPLVGEVRGTGLVAAVEVVADRAQKTPFDPELRVGRRLSAKLLDHALLSRPLGDSLALSPPLIIREEEIDELIERFRRGLDDLAEELIVEGTWKPA
jgi:L-2,4-diaminobutyrate transaminase